MRKNVNLHCHMCGDNIAHMAMNFDGEPLDEVVEVFTVRPAVRNGQYPAPLPEDRRVSTTDARYMAHASFCSECAVMYYSAVSEPRVGRCGCCGDKIGTDEPFFVLTLTHTSESNYYDEVEETVEVEEVVPEGKSTPDMYRCLECAQDMFDIEDESDPYTAVYTLADDLGYFDMTED